MPKSDANQADPCARATRSPWRQLLVVPWLGLMVSAIGPGNSLADKPRPKDATAEQTAEKDDRHEPAYTTESLRGRVAWLDEVLRRRYDIQVDADAAHTQCVLESNTGTLYPLVKDTRGRGFWLDERLRGSELELFVRRYTGSPLVQVIRVYTIKKDGKYELDYWCDVCSIPMYELKACECCQGTDTVKATRALTP